MCVLCQILKLFHSEISPVTFFSVPISYLLHLVLPAPHLASDPWFWKSWRISSNIQEKSYIKFFFNVLSAILWNSLTPFRYSVSSKAVWIPSFVVKVNFFYMPKLWVWGKGEVWDSGLHAYGRDIHPPKCHLFREQWFSLRAVPPPRGNFGNARGRFRW